MLGTAAGILIDRYFFWQAGRSRPLLGLDSPSREIPSAAAFTAALALAAETGAPSSVNPGPLRRGRRGGLPFRSLDFPSPRPLNAPAADNTVHARLYGELTPGRPALLYLHGWLQGSHTGMRELAALLERRGMPVLLPELPYHLQRRPRGEPGGARFITGDLATTADNLLQALAELAAAAAWLRQQGARPVTAGMSLGGLLVGLHCCLAPCPPERVLLLVPASRPGPALLTSAHTAGVRRELAARGVEPAATRELFAALDLARFAPRLDPQHILLAAARGDQVQPVKVSRELARRWGCRYRELPTGHIGSLLPLILGERWGIARGLAWWRELASFLTAED